MTTHLDTPPLSSPLTDADVADLLGATHPNAVRQRAMLWAALSPDGMILATFGEARSYETMLCAELIALSNGFLVEHGTRRGPDDRVLWIRERWDLRLRAAVAALSALDAGRSQHQRVLRWLAQPTNRVDAGQLLERLATDPSQVVALPPVPLSNADQAMGEWAAAAIAALA